MIDTLEVVDHITADCIEVGDVITFHVTVWEPEFDEVLTVVSTHDGGEWISVVGESEISGDREEYGFHPDDHVALLAEPVEEI